MAKSVTGIGYLSSGISLVTQPGIRRFVIIPVLINIVVFSGLIWYGSRMLGIPLFALSYGLCLHCLHF